jgi:hypothetical protein
LVADIVCYAIFAAFMVYSLSGIKVLNLYAFYNFGVDQFLRGIQFCNIHNGTLIISFTTREWRIQGFWFNISFSSSSCIFFNLGYALEENSILVFRWCVMRLSIVCCTIPDCGVSRCLHVHNLISSFLLMQSVSWWKKDIKN